MKINILYNFTEGAWGGGNQFLKALKRYFIEQKLYVDSPEEADIILFNSSPNALLLLLLLKRIFKIKKKNQQKIIINRMDGPIFLIREKNFELDRAFFIFNRACCDATVFQSEWSKKQNYKLGIEKNRFEAIIMNAPDPSIFNKHNKVPFNSDRKIRLISTSWSSNWKKGFEVYRWLDDNLDFRRFEMVFVGNSPIKFKNITNIQPVPSNELAMHLKQSDIFITASQNDPCSNSLIEALHCGLPAIGLNDGGHPEIIGQAGELFTDPREIPLLLDKLISNYQSYTDVINHSTMDDIGNKYRSFMFEIYEQLQREIIGAKKPAYVDYLMIRIKLLQSKLNAYISKLLDSHD